MVRDLIIVALAVLLVYAALSPLESLRWWTSKGRGQGAHTINRLLGEPRWNPADAPKNYLVYLSGVGALDPSSNSRRERALLQRITELVEDVVVLDDVFPYAVDNQGLLSGEHRRQGFWARLRRVRRKAPLLPVHYIINLRNAMQMFVSADKRYGPAYNFGIAEQIWQSLSRAGYHPDSGSTIHLLGYSGGGQIAIGAAWHLGVAGIDVSVISIGGMLSDDPGLDHVTHLTHLHGSKDRLQGLGTWLFPGRWPTAPLSSWHKAERAGRITMVELPGVVHDGPGDYFDPTPRDDGTNNAELTAAAIAEAVTRAGTQASAS